MNHIVIYTAGEIHTSWREEFGTALEGLEVEADLVGQQTVHDRSDEIGEAILGEQPGPRYRDLMGARMNGLRTRYWMDRADIGVAYFGPKYKQWNTASDAGAVIQAGLPLILVRAEEHIHALKELDAQATVTVETLEQAAQAVAYIFE